MSNETGPPFPANAVTIASSALTQLAYDAQQAALHVTFHDGTVYQYLGVPLHIYRELLRAESKGAYFNYRIRNTFANHKVL